MIENKETKTWVEIVKGKCIKLDYRSQNKFEKS